MQTSDKMQAYKHVKPKQKKTLRSTSIQTVLYSHLDRENMPWIIEEETKLPWECFDSEKEVC